MHFQEYIEKSRATLIFFPSTSLYPDTRDGYQTMSMLGGSSLVMEYPAYIFIQRYIFLKAFNLQ